MKVWSKTTAINICSITSVDGRNPPGMYKPCNGIHLPTSTGEFTGFLKHHPYFPQAFWHHKCCFSGGFKPACLPPHASTRSNTSPLQDGWLDGTGTFNGEMVPWGHFYVGRCWQKTREHEVNWVPNTTSSLERNQKKNRFFAQQNALDI